MATLTVDKRSLIRTEIRRRLLDYFDEVKVAKDAFPGMDVTKIVPALWFYFGMREGNMPKPGKYRYKQPLTIEYVERYDKPEEAYEKALLMVFEVQEAIETDRFLAQNDEEGCELVSYYYLTQDEIYIWDVPPIIIVQATYEIGYLQDSPGIASNPNYLHKY